MKHLVEEKKHFNIIHKKIDTICQIQNFNDGFNINDAFIFDLIHSDTNISECYTIIKNLVKQLPNKAVIGFIASNEVNAYLAYLLNKEHLVHYKYWITLRTQLKKEERKLLPTETISLLILSKAKDLKVSRVLLPYTYCPACNKTTKDYGGKKHTFHEFGTTMSDVWKDILYDMNSNMLMNNNFVIIERFALMLATEERNVYAIELSNDIYRSTDSKIIKNLLPDIPVSQKNAGGYRINNSMLINNDSLEELSKIADNTIDYVFVDPPYNLMKKYGSYDDNLEIENYFKWCDEWITECIRVLKPGKYFSILNIPQWCIRHFAALIQITEFESWITWDALSKPAGKVMPANYSILTFKKPSEYKVSKQAINLREEYMKPLADLFCLRASCVKKRANNIKPLSDLWTDIHRVKHNSLRYDHPCQLPADLMKRLIQIYSEPNDIVLDIFNGVGTTTLAAELIDRRYLGIELDSKYVNIARERHKMISFNQDPFGKNKIDATKKTKNNNIKRVIERKDEHKHITKKDVQLKMKSLFMKLERIPTIEDALQYYPEIPIEFYEMYFSSWSEVLSAIKVNGVKETKEIVIVTL